MSAAALAIILNLIPQVPALIAAIRNLRKQYPAMTQAEILALVSEITAQSDTAFDDVLAKIAADQKAA